jgi:type IV secretory pathway TrbL component
MSEIIKVLYDWQLYVVLFVLLIMLSVMIDIIVYAYKEAGKMRERY